MTAHPDKKIEEGFIGQRMIVLPPDVKRQINSNTLISSFYLTAIGYYPKAIYHDRERKQGINEYILLYCTEGEGYVNIVEIEQKLTANSFVIIPKDTAHHYRSSDSLPWSIYWIHFSGNNADALYRRYSEQDAADVQHIPYDKNKIMLFDRVFTILDHGFDETRLEIANIDLLGFIASLVYHKVSDIATSDTDTVSQSISFMKEHLGKKLTINQLADQSALSVSHYSRLFKQRTGSSPIDHFNLLKIQQSCQQLYFTDLSVKEIAATLGFDDQYYFSRLFTKLMGVSPMKYRNAHKR
ncbi:AraC family transcriptional regulator [Mucilaginibacter myungsuensis]|uniref:AraC family transcriptional regulator n=1 Tax=Mucilaginibacter myungsuensis TaxID=649104 RepID=A0A929PW00_9SPHI|nr:AraC family transcriptional regulator [Mucilaginibacter myungsuensis]MBE9660637.1 AraC family transcriptional regulator [Mucilaginibacter myungsuensis]MDN3600682.1 AraC family transcriptional regulator [Mucilaginibacter myungsuensis]